MILLVGACHLRKSGFDNIVLKRVLLETKFRGYLHSFSFEKRKTFVIILSLNRFVRHCPNTFTDAKEGKGKLLVISHLVMGGAFVEGISTCQEKESEVMRVM